MLIYVDFMQIAFVSHRNQDFVYAFDHSKGCFQIIRKKQHPAKLLDVARHCSTFLDGLRDVARHGSTFFDGLLDMARHGSTLLAAQILAGCCFFYLLFEKQPLK